MLTAQVLKPGLSLTTVCYKSEILCGSPMIDILTEKKRGRTNCRFEPTRRPGPASRCARKFATIIMITAETNQNQNVHPEQRRTM